MGSSRVILAIAGGIPVIVFLLMVVWARPRRGAPILSAVTVVAVGLVGLGVWAAFRGGGAAARPSAIVSASPNRPTTCSPSGTTLQLSAKGTAFDRACLAAPAARPFTISFSNQDAVSHSVHIFTADPARVSGAKSLFAGRIIDGGTSIDYHVPALPAGTYFFHCDVHPTQMFGTFVVG